MLPQNNTPNPKCFNAGVIGKMWEGFFGFLKWIFEKMGPTLQSVFRGIGSIINGEIGKNIIPPIVCIIVIICVWIAIFYGINSSSKNSSLNVKKPKLKNLFNPLSYIPMPTYKMKLFSYNFAPYSNVDTSTVDRPKIKGRCDNLKNYQSKGGNICMTTNMPEPIKWTLDIENMPELDKLLPSIKSIVDDDAKKYTVVIPWGTYDSHGMDYYPKYSEAFFENVTDITASKKAALLFEDKAQYCTKKSVPIISYSSAKRPTFLNEAYTGLDNFEEKNNRL